MQVTIRDAGDLKAVRRALRQASNGKDLSRQLTRELRSEIVPIVADVKAAWQSAPSVTHDPKLRRALAKATRGQVRLTGKEAGIRVRTDGRRMPDRAKSLPTLAEGTKRPWRHPVYGNRDVSVTQRTFPRFFRAVRPDQARVRRQIEQAVETVFKQIARAR
jgi:hypothetical protein